MLRVVQEALTNVYRHASATRVSIKFRRVGKRLDLVISDDGQSAEASGHLSAKPFRAGLGIPGMIARMQQFGGNLQIHSDPNGTVVHATVPVGKTAENTMAKVTGTTPRSSTQKRASRRQVAMRRTERKPHAMAATPVK
jgi:two-component system, NarL family, sensor kinase